MKKLLRNVMYLQNQTDEPDADWDTHTSYKEDDADHKRPMAHHEARFIDGRRQLLRYSHTWIFDSEPYFRTVDEIPEAQELLRMLRETNILSPPMYDENNFNLHWSYVDKFDRNRISDIALYFSFDERGFFMSTIYYLRIPLTENGRNTIQQNNSSIIIENEIPINIFRDGSWTRKAIEQFPEMTHTQRLTLKSYFDRADEISSAYEKFLNAFQKINEFKLENK